MQKNRKKQQDVAGRVDFRRARTFASGVVRTLLSSWSCRANLPPAPVTRHAALGCGGALGLGGALAFVGAVGCQPAAPAATPAAAHFEIPVAREPEPHRAGASLAPAGANAALAAPGLPQDLPAEFARQEVCVEGTCSLAHWLPDPSYAESPFEGIPAQAAIWVHLLKAHTKLALPPNAALELVVVCLAGELKVHDTMPAAGSTPPTAELSPWTALRAPGAGAELECGAADCRAMLALIAPHSTLGVAVRATPSAAPRSIPFEVRAFESAIAAAPNHGKNHVRILFGGVATNPPLPFSLTLLQAGAPALIVPHTHDSSWENLLVLEGHGDLELRGRSYPIGGGESLHIAPRVRHGYVARGVEPFVALQLYTPAGPEQRFLTPPADTPPPRASARPDADERAAQVPP